MIDVPTTPFSIKTPETLTPQEVVDEFVDHEALHKLTPSGHTLIQGPRGSGKSMLFRYMSPSSQCLAHSVTVGELPYVAVMLPCKRANTKQRELERLSPTARRLLIESLLVVMVATRTCQEFIELLTVRRAQDATLSSWIDAAFVHIQQEVSDAGYERRSDISLVETHLGKMELAQQYLGLVEREIQDYVDTLAFLTVVQPFPKRMLSYQFFLYPLFQKLHKLKSKSKQSFYLLIDDADWFNAEQIKVVNNWISYRTTDVLSLKVAYQISYPTFYTLGERRIESPHDYGRVNLGSIYTQGVYRKWVKEVVERRIKATSPGTTAEEFFPEDKQQLDDLNEIVMEIKSESWTGPRTQREGDDSYRYARPELIRRMGQKRQMSKYLYCGFDQLVDLSNTTIRFFLEAAAEMYVIERSRLGKAVINSVSPSVQNQVVRQQADHLFHSNFDEIIKDMPHSSADPSLVERAVNVRNLIDAMGSAFAASLISPVRSERRLLAFALQTEPDAEVRAVLNLAVALGYFKESSLGRKEGLGRTRRYVINRRICPHFTLDPSGFSGYLWVTSDFLRTAIRDPARARDEIRKRLPEIAVGQQMTLPGFAKDEVGYVEADDEED